MLNEIKTMVHDMKTPVVTIKTGVELAMEIIQGYQKTILKNDYELLNKLLQNALVGVSDINDNINQLNAIVIAN